MPQLDPNLYPQASRAQWFADDFPGDIMPHPNVLVLHSTEGTGWPAYEGGAIAPTNTFCPDFKRKRLEVRQHFPAIMSARALENRPGGVETNTLNVVQWEIVGTCDPTTHKRWKKAGIQHLYMPRLPAWAIRDLGAALAWLHKTYPIPLTSGVRWLAYPGSYGNRNGQRMTFGQWNSFNGVCGHEHVPEQNHGDPGKFPIKKLLAAAGGTVLADVSNPNPTDLVEDIMAMDEKQLEALIERAVERGSRHGVFAAMKDLLAGKYGSGIPNPMGKDYKGPKTWSLGSVLSYGAAWQRIVAAGINKLTKGK